MSYAEYLRRLLQPLRVYDLSAPYNGGELDAAGLSLDGVEAKLEETGREVNLQTAESWGLEKMAQLFACRPAADGPKALGAALVALLRISGDSFTLAAVNDTLTGCGVPAKAEEIGVGMVRVSFPTQAGEPENFAQLKQIIEEILPAHLSIEYWFWYLIWSELEQLFSRWQEIEDRELTWSELEICMK